MLRLFCTLSFLLLHNHGEVSKVAAHEVDYCQQSQHPRISNLAMKPGSFTSIARKQRIANPIIFVWLRGCILKILPAAQEALSISYSSSGSAASCREPMIARAPCPASHRQESLARPSICNVTQPVSSAELSISNLKLKKRCPSLKLEDRMARETSRVPGMSYSRERQEDPDNCLLLPCKSLGTP